MENNPYQNALLFASVDCDLLTTDRPSFPIPLHWHYYGEIIRVRKGSLRVHREDRSYLLNTGDAVFISPLMHHSVDLGEPGAPATYELIRMDMEQFGDLPSYSPDLRGLVLEAEHRGLPMVFTAQTLHENHVDNMIDMCVQEFRCQAYGYDMRIRSLLYLIFTDIIRIWIGCGFVPQNYASRIDPIYALPSYIARNVQNSLKVEDLAEYCGLSYPWFARKFHQIYGVSCKEYIEKVRLRRVEHYLQYTDCDLNYISRNTGYADCSHLVRDFRKFRNMTPGRFRKAARQKLQGVGSFPKTIDMP